MRGQVHQQQARSAAALLPPGSAMTVPDVDHNAVICRDRSTALLRHTAGAP
jgi:hypothetical protein